MSAVKEFAEGDFFAQLWLGPEETKSEKSARRQVLVWVKRKLVATRRFGGERLLSVQGGRHSEGCGVCRYEERRVEREEASVSQALEEVRHGRLGKRRGRQPREKRKGWRPSGFYLEYPPPRFNPFFFYGYGFDPYQGGFMPRLEGSLGRC
jgi:hypothetical protein